MWKEDREMAVIDFSNAVIEKVGLLYTGSSSTSAYANGLGLLQPTFYTVMEGSSSEVQINENTTYQVLENTPTKIKVMYMGQIKAGISGNYFTIYSNSNKTWRISNISYNEGDTYSFTIEVDLSNI